MTKLKWLLSGAMLLQALTAAHAAGPKVQTLDLPMKVTIGLSTKPGCEPNCQAWISAQGKITAGHTLKEFKAVLRQLKGRKVPVFLHSGGGDVSEAYAIGNLIRANGLDTAVINAEARPSEFGVCASACVFILAAGKRRFAGPRARVGVHQLLVHDPSMIFHPRLSATQALEAMFYREMQQYFTSMGVSQDIVRLARSAPFSSMYWMTQAELDLTKLVTSRASGLELVPDLPPPAVAAAPPAATVFPLSQNSVLVPLGEMPPPVASAPCTAPAAGKGPETSTPQPQAGECKNGVVVSVVAGGKRCFEPGSGSSFKDCPECPEMVVVPAASFIMGSPQREPERFGSEGPQHEVNFARPFAVGKFAVTFSEWDACTANRGCGGYMPDDQGGRRGSYPVINVNWADAHGYVAWLSKKTGKKYRLLSEAEREYVTRAGTKTPFWWGGAITPCEANYCGDCNAYKGGGRKGEYRLKTMPVDSLQANPWGLFHVHGNVSEWVEDCWHDSYDGAPQDGSAWTAGRCNSHVFRGGSWANNPGVLRAASRLTETNNPRMGTIGFRVARTLD